MSSHSAEWFNQTTHDWSMDQIFVPQRGWPVSALIDHHFYINQVFTLSMAVSSVIASTNTLTFSSINRFEGVRTSPNCCDNSLYLGVARQLRQLIGPFSSNDETSRGWFSEPFNHLLRGFNAVDTLFWSCFVPHVWPSWSAPSCLPKCATKLYFLLSFISLPNKRAKNPCFPLVVVLSTSLIGDASTSSSVTVISSAVSSLQPCGSSSHPTLKVDNNPSTSMFAKSCGMSLWYLRAGPDALAYFSSTDGSVVSTVDINSAKNHC